MLEHSCLYSPSTICFQSLAQHFQCLCVCRPTRQGSVRHGTARHGIYTAAATAAAVAASSTKSIGKRRLIDVDDDGLQLLEPHIHTYIDTYTRTPYSPFPFRQIYALMVCSNACAIKRQRVPPPPSFTTRHTCTTCSLNKILIPNATATQSTVDSL